MCMRIRVDTKNNYFRPNHFHLAKYCSACFPCAISYCLGRNTLKEGCLVFMFLLLSGSLTAAFHPAKLFAVYRSRTTRHTFSLLLHGWSQAVHVIWPGLVRLLFSGLKESQGRVAMGSTQGQDGEQEMEFWKIFLKTHGLVVGVVKGFGGRGEEEPKAAIEVTWAARWVVLLFTGVRSRTRLDPFSVTETTKCRLCFLVSVQMFLGPFFSPQKEAREVGLPPGLACVSGVSSMEYLSE